MALNPRTDVGSHVVCVQANAQATAAGKAIALVAGATEDGVAVVGTTINRLNAQSCTLALTGLATLTNTETLSFAVEYQLSSDASSWDTAVSLQAATVIATGGASIVDFALLAEFNLNLKPMKQYIRFNVTPAMSAGSADDAVWSCTCVLAGFDVLPATQAS